MNKELIEQIRNGKALHYDIDNVELLNVVIREVYPLKGQLFGYYEYYYLENKLECSDSTDRDTIPLSSFLDTPKMISVEAVKDWVDTQSKVYKAIPIDQLLTFLNTHTNVK